MGWLKVLEWVHNAGRSLCFFVDSAFEKSSLLWVNLRSVLIVRFWVVVAITSLLVVVVRGFVSYGVRRWVGYVKG